jgi:preprotein translocase subunit YajC
LYLFLFFMGGGGAASSGGSSGGGGGGGGLDLFLPIILIFAIFFFLVILPQQRQAKKAATERQKMLDNIEKGDRVITHGGIIGEVSGFKENRDVVLVEIAKGIVIELARAKIEVVGTTQVSDEDATKQKAIAPKK